MKRLFWILCLSILPLLAGAEERFPPPEFDTGYTQPQMTQPLPRSLLAEYLDTSIFAAALAAASWLAVRKRSRRGLVWLPLFSLLYFGFWKKGCICPVGAIQNAALALGDPSYLIPLTAVIFFLLPLAAALFCGRTFCAGVCPFGALQELILLKPVRVPVWLDHALGLLPFVYLGAAVLFAATGSAFIICEYDPFVAFFRMDGSAPMVWLGFAVLIVSVFIGRFYCRYACPYGAILGVFARVSQWHVSITPNACIDCRLCEEACPYGAILPPAPERPAPGPAARRNLLALLLLLPALILSGGWLGAKLGGPFSRMHATVNLAEAVAQEEKAQRTEAATDATRAFRSTGQAADELYAQARTLRGRFVFGGALFGAFLGLVAGLKLIQLSLLRRRTDYTIQRPACLACGRCFEYCPKEHAFRGTVAPAAQEAHSA